MKKFTFQIFAILAFAFSWQVNAQFTESFDSEIPATWSVVDVDGGNTWVYSDAQSYSGDGSARITYNSNAHDDYLISPQFTVTAGISDRISFWAASYLGYVESFEVLLSTTGNAPADFSVSLGDELASADAPAFEQFSYDLSAYDGTPVYIAIKATGTDQFYLYVDEFVNDAAPACTAAVVSSSAVIDNCAGSNYTVFVDFTSVGDATAVSDGTNTYPIVGTSVTAGPFAIGTPQTLSVVHSDAACDFSLGNFSDSCPANQDTCATADVVTEGSYTTTINQGTGGSEMGTGGDSAFFIFTAPGDGTLNVNSCNGGADSFLNIGTGTCGALVVEGSNDDNCASGLGNNYASEVEITVVGGTDYYIEWDDRYSSGANTFDWSITFTPAPLCIAGVATATIVEDCVAETFVINVDVTTVGNATEIFDGTDTFAISGTGVVPVGPYAFGTSVTLDLVHDDAACDFELGTYDFAGCPPANDECAGAETVACGGQYTGDTSLANPESPDPGTCTTSAGTAGAVWYTITGANSNDAGAVIGSVGDEVTLDLSLSTFDTKIRVFEGACGAFTCVGGNDDGGTGNTSLFTFTATVGTEYYILVHGFSGNAGAYTLDVTCVAPPLCTPGAATATIVEDCVAETFVINVDVTTVGNATEISDGTDTYAISGAGIIPVGPYAFGTSVTLDIVHDDAACDFELGTYDFAACPATNVDCANATPIACGDTISTSSVGSTGNSEDIGCSMGSNGLWFTFVGTGGDITVSSTASFDHRQGIASGTCGSLVNIVCDDQSTGAETHTFASNLGETYYVYIANYSSSSSSTGAISITLTCAVVPTCTQAVVDSSTIVETCNPDGTGTFVVNHVVSNAGDAGTVFDDGTNTYPVTVGTVTTGPYNSGDSVTIELVGVDSDCDFTVGTYTFTCPQPAPPYDEITDPIKLQNGSAVCEDPVVVTNVGATDSIEAGASCGTPEGDLWFQIEIPNTGELTVETSTTSGGVTDTVMAIYSGTPGNLVEIACDDDGGPGLFSSIALTGYTPGEQFYVRVWEFGNNNFGTFSICAWSPTTLSVDTNVIEGFSYYPNPVSNVLNVKAQNSISNVAVYNMLGQEVLRTAPNTVASEVNMSNLQTGAYFVKVTIGDTTKTIRVIKN